MVQTPSLRCNQFDRFEMATNQLLQEMGALKKQQPLGLSPRTGGQSSQPFDQGIASAADQGRGGIQRTTSERCVFAHLQAFVNAQIFAIQLKAVDGCDLTLDSLRRKVFDHLFDHLILNCGVIDGIRSCLLYTSPSPRD